MIDLVLWCWLCQQMIGSRGLTVLTATAVLTIGGVSYASLGGGSATIKGCVGKRSGVLRVVGNGSHCRSSERALTFAKKGPRGPQGLPGQQGMAGPTGPPGPAGPSAYAVVQGGGCSGIQAAIDALPPAGGAVLVPAGTYVCTAPIEIDRNSVSLRGVGPATVLRLGDEVNRPVLVVGEAVASPTTIRRDIDVSDLAIDGNRTQQQFECSSGPCTGGEYLRNNGISLRHVEDVTVEHVSVTGARSGGLVVELSSRRVRVHDFSASDSQFDGLAGYDTEDSVFSGLYLHDNAAAGLSFDNDFDGNTISDSVLADNGDVGVFMRDATDNVFAAVRIRDSFKDGVYLAENNQNNDPALGNTFSDMVISGSGDVGAPAEEGYGVKVVNASCTDNLLVASQLVDNRDGAVSEASVGLLTKSANVFR